MGVITNIKIADDGKVVIAENDLDGYIDSYIDKKFKKHHKHILHEHRVHEHSCHNKSCCASCECDLAADLAKIDLKYTTQKEIILNHIECLEKNAAESNENVKKIINMIEQKNAETNRRINTLQTVIAVGFTVLTFAFIISEILPYMIR